MILHLEAVIYIHRQLFIVFVTKNSGIYNEKYRNHFQNKITIWHQILFVFFTWERVSYVVDWKNIHGPSKVSRMGKINVQLNISNINQYTNWQSVAPKCLLHTLYYQCANPSIIVRLHDQGTSNIICHARDGLKCQDFLHWKGYSTLLKMFTVY